MTVKEADDSVFDFELPRGEALSEETLVRCPACGAWSPLSEWNESEIGTGTSDWSAVQCPACQNPAHYRGDYVMRVIEDFGLDFLRGTVVKYLLRAGQKGSELEDLKKAQWYLNRKIAALESPRPSSPDSRRTKRKGPQGIKRNAG